MSKIVSQFALKKNEDDKGGYLFTKYNAAPSDSLRCEIQKYGSDSSAPVFSTGSNLKASEIAELVLLSEGYVKFTII